jgi:5-methylcytosine-specific restriction endonuclease McrA
MGKKRARKHLLQLCCEWDWKCPYCGNAFGTSYSRRGRWQGWLRPTLEHIVPKSFGGDHTKENLLAICQVCNSLKYNQLFKSYQVLISYLQRKWRMKGFRVDTDHGEDNSQYGPQRAI